MIVDANLLIYAVDPTSPQHDRAKEWLEAQLNGTTRVGLPWPSLLAFMRISTNPRAAAHPLSASKAWAFVRAWLDAPTAWLPSASARQVEIFGDLVERYDVRGNLVPDAHLAAYAIEHGVPLASADTDFARFSEVRWFNPVAPGAGDRA